MTDSIFSSIFELFIMLSPLIGIILIIASAIRMFMKKSYKQMLLLGLVILLIATALNGFFDFSSFSDTELGDEIPTI